jgi:hypothetical protein
VKFLFSNERQQRRQRSDRGIDVYYTVRILYPTYSPEFFFFPPQRNIVPCVTIVCNPEVDVQFKLLYRCTAILYTLHTHTQSAVLYILYSIVENCFCGQPNLHLSFSLRYKSRRMNNGVTELIFIKSGCKSGNNVFVTLQSTALDFYNIGTKMYITIHIYIYLFIKQYSIRWFLSLRAFGRSPLSDDCNLRCDACNFSAVRWG